MTDKPEMETFHAIGIALCGGSKLEYVKFWSSLVYRRDLRVAFLCSPSQCGASLYLNTVNNVLSDPVIVIYSGRVPDNENRVVIVSNAPVTDLPSNFQVFQPTGHIAVGPETCLMFKTPEFKKALLEQIQNPQMTKFMGALAIGGNGTTVSLTSWCNTKEEVYRAMCEILFTGDNAQFFNATYDVQDGLAGLRGGEAFIEVFGSSQNQFFDIDDNGLISIKPEYRGDKAVFDTFVRIIDFSLGNEDDPISLGYQIIESF